MIICAALLVQVEGLDHTTILPCHRHGVGFRILEDLGYAPKTKYKVIEQGFIDHQGNFLNRVDAFNHVKECGQCNATQGKYNNGFFVLPTIFVQREGRACVTIELTWLKWFIGITIGGRND